MDRSDQNSKVEWNVNLSWSQKKQNGFLYTKVALYVDMHDYIYICHKKNLYPCNQISINLGLSFHQFRNCMLCFCRIHTSENEQIPKSFTFLSFFLWCCLIMLYYCGMYWVLLKHIIITLIYISKWKLIILFCFLISISMDKYVELK